MLFIENAFTVMLYATGIGGEIIFQKVLHLYSKWNILTVNLEGFLYLASPQRFEENIVYYITHELHIILKHVKETHIRFVIIIYLIINCYTN